MRTRPATRPRAKDTLHMTAIPSSDGSCFLAEIRPPAAVRFSVLAVGRPGLAVERLARLRRPRRRWGGVEAHAERQLIVPDRLELGQQPELGERERETRARAHLGRVPPVTLIGGDRRIRVEAADLVEEPLRLTRLVEHDRVFRAPPQLEWHVRCR